VPIRQRQLVNKERGPSSGLRALENELDTPVCRWEWSYRARHFICRSQHQARQLVTRHTTIPDQIATDKQPYYKALEAADRAWVNEKVDVSELEAVIEAMLSQQLINAVKQASGEALT
jgi:hypothetical protein